MDWIQKCECCYLNEKFSKKSSSECCVKFLIICMRNKHSGIQTQIAEKKANGSHFFEMTMIFIYDWEKKKKYKQTISLSTFIEFRNNFPQFTSQTEKSRQCNVLNRLNWIMFRSLFPNVCVPLANKCSKTQNNVVLLFFFLSFFILLRRNGFLISIYVRSNSPGIIFMQNDKTKKKQPKM